MHLPSGFCPGGRHDGWRSCQASTSLNSICLVRRMLSRMHNYVCMSMRPRVLYECPQNLLKMTDRRRKYLVLRLSPLLLSSPLSSSLDRRSWPWCYLDVQLALLILLRLPHPSPPRRPWARVSMIDAAKVPVAELTVAVVPDVAGPSTEALKSLAKAFKEKRGHRPHIEPLPQETGCPRTGAEFAECVVGRFDSEERKKGGGEVPTLHNPCYVSQHVLMHHAASHSIKYYSC